MTVGDVISFDQWSDLSRRVGGDLFTEPRKLEAMRRIDRQFGTDVSWAEFCDLVAAEIEGQWIVSPLGRGKGVGTVTMTGSSKGLD